MTTKVSSQARINVADLVEAVRKHPLYEHVSDEHSLRLLMRTHVFAVWDFQSLLKSLQRSLTCVDVPWLPTADAEARRFVNEIVLEEESDAAPGGGYLSHFELYVQAMTECGAALEPIEMFVRQVREGHGGGSACAASPASRCGQVCADDNGDSPQCPSASLCSGVQPWT